MVEQNVIQGDSFGTDLPKTEVDETLLNEEKKKAKYSKTKEFKEIRAYWEARKEFFKSYTPSGAEIRFQVPDEKIAQMWVLANNMINEIDVFLSQYDLAVEAVKEDKNV